MKLFRHLLPVCLLLLGQAAAVASGDASGNADVPGIHAIGNGELCVYGRGADILQIFGPPYSSPSLLTLSLCDGLQVASEREVGSSVWNPASGRSRGRGPAYRFRRGRQSGIRAAFPAEAAGPLPGRAGGTLPSFRGEPELRGGRTSRLVDRRAERLSRRSEGRRSVLQYVPKSFGLLLPARDYRNGPSGAVRGERTRADADRLAGRGRAVRDRRPLPGRTRPRDGPDRLRFRACLVEDGIPVRKPAECHGIGSVGRTAARVSAGRRRRGRTDPQSSEGSVLAGIIYHMGYVRDQYGVSRALLALGEWERARMILDFYWRVWQRSGLIHNAQAIGYPGIFHRHENDETEITGYLVVQAFDYYRKTRDTAFLREIMPMLEWATEAQQRNLIDGMLPFNGDETYIAGGVVPRQVMYHGSAEATLLFVEGSRRLIRFVREQGLWSAARIGALEHDVDECSERFRDNFCRDGHLYVNNPRRERKVAYPPTRPGVCLYPGHFDYFPETYHFKGCLYFCKDCMTKDHAAVELPEPELFSIPSANLFPIYIGSELFSESEKRAFLDDVIALYERTGKISGQDRILGYDFGMFLYALCETGHPLRDEVYDRMMSLRDGAGAWVEYYVDGRPSGCGCRPWESGINIEAAIRYAR